MQVRAVAAEIARGDARAGEAHDRTLALMRQLVADGRVGDGYRFHFLVVLVVHFCLVSRCVAVRVSRRQNEKLQKPEMWASTILQKM